MNDKMVFVTAGVSFVVKANGSDSDLDSIISSAAAASQLANGSGSTPHSSLSDDLDYDYEVIDGTSAIGKLMEDLSRSVGNGSSFIDDENFAIEVVFGAKNGSKKVKAAGNLKSQNAKKPLDSNHSTSNGLKESTLKAKRKQLQDLKKWITEEFKSAPPSAELVLPSEDFDDAFGSGDALELCDGREDMKNNIRRSIERSEAVFKMSQSLVKETTEDLKTSCSALKKSEEVFASVKSLTDFKFKNFCDFVLTKLIVSVMDNRRTIQIPTPAKPPFSSGMVSTPDPRTTESLKPVPDASSAPNYLEDEEFMTEMCYDTMMETFQQSLCAHLGELAKSFDPRQLSCHSLRWFDTQEVLEHSRLLNPYADFGMPSFDAKGRSLNIVMLTEFSNILQVHCRNLPQQVFQSLEPKIQKNSWIPLVETCCHYGIMLHDFLASLNQKENWKVLRKCVWLVVSFLKTHHLIKGTLAHNYLQLAKPELSSAFLGISNALMVYEHPSIPRGFGSNLQPFRFFHWYLNPCQIPAFLGHHVYLNDYIKNQLPSPRLHRAWDSIEERNSSKAGKQPANASQNKIKEALRIFVQVERKKLSMNIQNEEAYVIQSVTTVLLFELAYWLKMVMAAKKSYAPDAYYLCWRHFDDPTFFVPISCADHAMRKQYCKREVIYYLVTRFCLNILHHEMEQAGESRWDKSSIAFKTFMFLFRRLFLPYAEPDSFAFDETETCYDRYSAKILVQMRNIMEREKSSQQFANNKGYCDLHMEKLTLFTNETTQTYVRLEQQVTASLNDVILSAENQKQVDNFITRVLEALVSISTDKNVDQIDWPFIGRCVPLYILDLYKLLAKNNLLGYPSVFAYSTKTFIDKFIHEQITKDKKTIDQFFTQQIHGDSRICPFDKIQGNPFVKLADKFFRAEEARNPICSANLDKSKPAKCVKNNATCDGDASGDRSKTSAPKPLTRSR